MYRVVKRFIESIVDPETKEQYERESYTLSGTDPQSIAASYLDYNREVGGEAFGFTTGMPIEVDPEKYGGIAKMYRECIRRGIAWEELLQWDGHSDEIHIC